MAPKWCYFFFMVWLSYLIISSVLLFGRGFLLSKNAQKTKSTCTVSQMESSFRNSEQLSVCLPQKARVLFVIIDALRYDFFLYNTTLKQPQHFQNKLPIVNQLLTHFPEHSRLYKFVADPPTTTMQRLKALTTGSLPTFVDAGSNFATNEIDEDNIIDQLNFHNFTTVLIGDDTWDTLYPNRFLRKYPFPSFDVWDLDTVDTGVNLHLYKEIRRKDWTLLIAHYLGVDHCGHRYGPSHPEMERKLGEMNQVLEDMAEQIDPDTILVVLGDHGMTETGNHGGDSEDEVTAGLFIYSKKILQTYASQQKTVKQVNIVPTLAAIFGVSVPFSNLGTVILDAIPTNGSKSWEVSLFHLWANTVQMYRYIESYVKLFPDTFDHSDLKSMHQQYSSLKTKILLVDSEQSFETFAKDCISFLTNMRENCEKIWVEFEPYSMVRGLVFSSLTIIFGFLLTGGIQKKDFPKVFTAKFILVSYCVVLLTIFTSFLLHYVEVASNLISFMFFSTGLVSILLLLILIVQKWHLITLNLYNNNSRSILILVLHLAGLSSNSFVVEEASVLLFLTCSLTLLCWLFFSKSKAKWQILFILFSIIFLVRSSRYFWQCRERLEQPWCYEETHSNKPNIKTEWLISVLGLVVFVTVTKLWLKNSGNLKNDSLSAVFPTFSPYVLVICVSAFWLLSRVFDSKMFRELNVLAWTVYSASFLGVFLVIFRPLLVYILPTSKHFHEDSSDKVIPQVFRKVKDLFNSGQKDEVVVIYGLGTAYSAFFLVIASYVFYVFSLIQGVTALSVLLMVFTVFLLLLVTALVRIQQSKSVEDLFDIPSILILIWLFSCQYSFYGTGHQPSFPNILWDAAFVGTAGLNLHNSIPATLIIINTFCSQIFSGFLVPLFVIFPFTTLLQFPSLAKRMQKTDFEGSKGEMLAHEQENLLFAATFQTSCRYVICHGTRVFVTMLVATIHCRHMMIWKIFAPKLIFEAIGLVVTVIVVNLGYLLLIRVNAAVEELLTRINRKSR